MLCWILRQILLSLYVNVLLLQLLLLMLKHHLLLLLLLLLLELLASFELVELLLGGPQGLLPLVGFVRHYLLLD
jgi:hypothetical protein